MPKPAKKIKELPQQLRTLFDKLGFDQNKDIDWFQEYKALASTLGESGQDFPLIRLIKLYYWTINSQGTRSEKLLFTNALERNQFLSLFESLLEEELDITGKFIRVKNEYFTLIFYAYLQREKERQFDEKLGGNGKTPSVLWEIILKSLALNLIDPENLSRIIDISPKKDIAIQHEYKVFLIRCYEEHFRLKKLSLSYCDQTNDLAGSYKLFLETDRLEVAKTLAYEKDSLNTNNPHLCQAIEYFYANAEQSDFKSDSNHLKKCYALLAEQIKQKYLRDGLATEVKNIKSCEFHEETKQHEEIFVQAFASKATVLDEEKIAIAKYFSILGMLYSKNIFPPQWKLAFQYLANATLFLGEIENPTENLIEIINQVDRSLFIALRNIHFISEDLDSLMGDLAKRYQTIALRLASSEEKEFSTKYNTILLLKTIEYLTILPLQYQGDIEKKLLIQCLNTFSDLYTSQYYSELQRALAQAKPQKPKQGDRSNIKYLDKIFSDKLKENQDISQFQAKTSAFLQLVNKIDEKGIQLSESHTLLIIQYYLLAGISYSQFTPTLSVPFFFFRALTYFFELNSDSEQPNLIGLINLAINHFKQVGLFLFNNMTSPMVCNISVMYLDALQALYLLKPKEYQRDLHEVSLKVHESLQDLAVKQNNFLTFCENPSVFDHNLNFLWNFFTKSLTPSIINIMGIDEAYQFFKTQYQVSLSVNRNSENQLPVILTCLYQMSVVNTSKSDDRLQELETFLRIIIRGHQMFQKLQTLRDYLLLTLPNAISAKHHEERAAELKGKKNLSSFKKSQVVFKFSLGIANIYKILNDKNIDKNEYPEKCKPGFKLIKEARQDLIASGVKSTPDFLLLNYFCFTESTLHVICHEHDVKKHFNHIKRIYADLSQLPTILSSFIDSSVIDSDLSNEISELMRNIKNEQEHIQKLFATCTAAEEKAKIIQDEKAQPKVLKIKKRKKSKSPMEIETKSKTLSEIEVKEVVYRTLKEEADKLLHFQSLFPTNAKLIDQALDEIDDLPQQNKVRIAWQENKSDDCKRKKLESKLIKPEHQAEIDKYVKLINELKIEDTPLAGLESDLKNVQSLREQLVKQFDELQILQKSLLVAAEEAQKIKEALVKRESKPKTNPISEKIKKEQEEKRLTEEKRQQEKEIQERRARNAKRHEEIRQKLEAEAKAELEKKLSETPAAHVTKEASKESKEVKAKPVIVKKEDRRKFLEYAVLHLTHMSATHFTHDKDKFDLKNSSHSLPQDFDLLDQRTRYALLYDIFRFFLALKIYHARGGKPSENLSNELVTDMRNMIHHRGVLVATLDEVLKLSDQLRGQLPLELKKLQKHSLKQCALSERLIQKVDETLNFVEEHKSDLIFNDEFDLTNNVLFTTWCDFHRVPEKTELKEKQEIKEDFYTNQINTLNEIWPLLIHFEAIGNVFIKTNPHPPVAKEFEFFQQTYFREINSLKLLISLLGSYIGTKTCDNLIAKAKNKKQRLSESKQKEINIVIDYYEFLKECHNKRNLVGHCFPDFNISVIYDLFKVVQRISKKPSLELILQSKRFAAAKQRFFSQEPDPKDKALIIQTLKNN